MWHKPTIQKELSCQYTFDIFLGGSKNNFSKTEKFQGKALKNYFENANAILLLLKSTLVFKGKNTKIIFGLLVSCETICDAVGLGEWRSWNIDPGSSGPPDIENFGFSGFRLSIKSWNMDHPRLREIRKML